MKKFKITIGDKNYEITAERDSANPSLLNLTVDGNAHSIQIEEEEAPKSTPGPRRAAAPSKPSGGGGGEGSIVAQIPGTVLDVEVSVGDSVNEGDRLIVLEAMKMENVITAESSGTVQSVNIAKGDKVVAGQLMMEIS
ncbi:MAG: biotin attachment protein [Nitrospinaceae bacterium]|nr:biotin attachment protein [Nitrospinaceae bacterium]MBT3432697.1 biotin attachment protein [Nitrospinaceae bacterium]MBT3821955.1 biotin attachment protein [Nitrospinaceae bacterium]MBT4094498.1 biotin attachment protein [Nitrospinaceae bacterium]MBT4429753.1 biotin attachment protein [Nitrospinaceae bacterium]